MIFDVLENAQRYLPLHNGFAQAFAFLSRPDLNDLPLGRHEIAGDRIYAVVAREPGRRQEDAQLEIHERYIDIQYIISGTDTMGWKPTLACKQPTQSYDPERDIQFFADKPDAWVSTHGGAFTIFFPEDAHMPLLSAGEIHKVVVKIAVVG